MAEIKAKNPVQALVACRQALALDPGNVKALLREVREEARGCRVLRVQHLPTAQATQSHSRKGFAR
eukprot:SAG11_NODE_3444_length_2443_cov_3.221843_2_plen_66_part_00